MQKQNWRLPPLCGKHGRTADRTFDVTDAGVLAGMKATPREFFVDQNLVSLAYSDACLTVTGRDRGS